MNKGGVKKKEGKKKFGGQSTFHKDSKRTKKFKANHLQGVIEKRKQIQKLKGRRNKKSTDEEEEEEEEEPFTYDGPSLDDDEGDDQFMKEEEEDEEEEKYFEESEEEEEEEEEEGEGEAEARHKAELEILKKQDPDFVKYLQETDSALLRFGKEEGEEDDEEEDGEEGEEKAEKSQVLTQKKIKEMYEEAKDGKKESLKKLMVAFRCGCYSAGGQTKGGQQVALPYEIPGDKTFQYLMELCLKNSNYLFQMYLGPNFKNWNKMEKVIHSFLKHWIYYISTSANNDSVLSSLQHLNNYVQYLSKAKGVIAKRMLKVVLEKWSENSNLEIKSEAFKIIREMAIKVPYPFINNCYKAVYLHYVRESKFYNPSTFKSVHFMAECVVELFLLDPITTYQHAFVYIRQLAIHLRNYIQTKTKEALAHVYSWQFINSIRVWSMLLSKHAVKKSEEKVNLDQLVFPLIQVILGTIRANGSSRYYPLRFLCIEFVNEIVASTHSLVNTSSYILEVLSSPELKKKTKASGNKLNFEMNLKASKSQLATTNFQDFLIQKVYYTLLQSFSVHSNSIAFPEMVIPVVNQLKKFNKKCTVPNWKRKITQVIEQFEKNSKYVVNHRTQIDFSPKNFDKTANFLAGAKTPLIQYFQQLKSNEEQIKKLKKYDYEEENQEDEEDESGDDQNGDEDQSDEEEEEEEKKVEKKELPLKRKKKEISRNPKKLATGKKDLVEDFQFSESENESE